MGKAQDAYAALLRDHLGPSLRALGFRGSRGAYLLPNNEYWVRIGVQSSAWNTGERVDFTLNVSVISKPGWDKLRQTFPGIQSRQPQANAFYDAPAFGDNPGFWQSRLGHLISPSRDQWWMVTPSSDLKAIASEVLEAIREGALPAIAERTGLRFQTRPLPPDRFS
jgi:Domain of unknown function (DUF4304)